MNKIKLFLIVFLSLTNNVLAKQSVETTPWGYSGIINVPNSNVLDKSKFYINSAYTFRTPSFLSSFQMGLFDNLEIGILGGVPSNIFSGLAGNLKYQMLKQSDNIPLSFAMGINVLGIPKIGSNNIFNLGNNLYMVASHDLNVNIFNNSYNILSAHLGFSGNLERANLLAAIDIPITKFVNLDIEYISRSNLNNEMLNFGIKIKPIDELSINFFTLGTTFSQGFTNTEYMLGISYNNYFNDSRDNNKNSQKAQEKKEEIKKIENAKEEKKKVQEGSLRIDVFDENDNSQISNIKVIVENKENNFSKTFEINQITNTINNLKYGEYKLVLDKENYSTLVYPIKIDSNFKNINVKMKKLSSSIIGKVFNNNSIPYPDLEVILDDNFKVKTDKEGKFSFINVLPGKHIVKISKNDQVLKKIDIDLPKGMELKREIYLDEIKSVLNKNDIKENSKKEIDQKKEDTKKIENKNDDQKVITNKNLENSNIENSKKEIDQKKEDTKKIENKNDNQKNEKKLNNSLIVGKVTSSGNILSLARITLEGDKITIMTLSNKEGFYLIKKIPPGEYKITATKEGFLSKTFKINLTENKQYKLDIELEKKN